VRLVPFRIDHSGKDSSPVSAVEGPDGGLLEADRLAADVARLNDERHVVTDAIAVLPRLELDAVLDAVDGLAPGTAIEHDQVERPGWPFRGMPARERVEADAIRPWIGDVKARHVV